MVTKKDLLEAWDKMGQEYTIREIFEALPDEPEQERKGLDFTKDNVWDALGRPDLKPEKECHMHEWIGNKPFCRWCHVNKPEQEKKELPEWEVAFDKRGVEWHQGELTTCHNNLKQFIRAEFEKMGREIKIVTRETYYGGSTIPQNMERIVDGALRRRGVKI